MSPRKASRTAADELLTRPQLAARLGVSAATVQKWIRDGLPVAQRGKRGQASRFDPAAVVAWREARDAAAQAEVVSLSEQRALLARAQRAKVERENAEAEGQLAYVPDVIAMGAHFVKGWMALLRGIPRQARRAGIVATAEQERALAALIRKLLEEVTRWQVPAPFAPKRRGKGR